MDDCYKKGNRICKFKWLLWLEGKFGVGQVWDCEEGSAQEDLERSSCEDSEEERFVCEGPGVAEERDRSVEDMLTSKYHYSGGCVRELRLHLYCDGLFEGRRLL